MAERIKINGIKAFVSLCDRGGNSFTESERCGIVEGALRVLDSPDEVIRDGESGRVFCGKINAGSRVFDVVVKSKRLKNFVFFRGNGGVKNFRKCRLLEANGIDSVFCLAGFNVKLGGFWESVLVTERLSGGVDLYELMFSRALQMGGSHLRRLKCELTDSLCELLRRFEKSGFYHRDAKAQNFAACEVGGKWHVLLIDLDGIKRPVFFTFKKRRRFLAKLGGSLIPCEVLNLSDYLRFFRCYCFKKGIDWSRFREEFRRVSVSGAASRLSTFVNSVNSYYRKQRDNGN